MTPKVSVVAAVYNSEKYLQQMIKSLTMQTLTDVEFIFVDDDSTDQSLNVIKEWAAKDSRIQVFVNKEVSDGAAMARNIGIAHASGKYLSVLDADDFFEPDMLEKAYLLAEDMQADVVIYDGFRYDDRNQIDLERNSILCRDKLPAGKKVFAPRENAENLFLMTLGAAWNVLLNKEFVDQYELRFQSFHHADDLEFVFLSFALAKKIAILPERLIHYRVNHVGSQASMISRWPDTAWKAMLSFKNHLAALGIYEAYQISYVRKAMHYIIFYLDNMNSEDSFRRLYHSLQDGKLKELGLVDADVQEMGDSYLAAVRDLLAEHSSEEYLFRKLKGLSPFDRVTSWKNRIPKDSRLILYGADRTGVDVFHSILWNQDYKVAAWVDRQYAELGYPVVSPDVLPDCIYDYVLVTNLSYQIYEAVRDFLLDRGVPIEKIRWMLEGIEES